MTSGERAVFELDQWSLSYDAKRVLLLPGDGVGPEVVEAAKKVLHAVADAFDRQFLFDMRPIGAAAIERTGAPLPPDVLEACERADAILLGAVGAAGGAPSPGSPSPEDGLLALRRALGLFANLRPVRVEPYLARTTPYRAGRFRRIDLMIVRELAGGLYYGEPRGFTTDRNAEGESVGRAVNSMVYSTEEVARVAEVAFRLAARRRGRVASVDKANVLEVSRLWRRTVSEVASRHPGVELEHLYVDNAAFQLVRDPARFDVLLTENLFGDILSDLAGGIAGSIALLPSASLGAKTALFEPVHGTAFELVGTGRANPIGAILSAALMLRHAFTWEREAQAVESAVDVTLGAGWHTQDMAFHETGGRGDGRLLGTSEMAERVAAAVRAGTTLRRARYDKIA
jgi:3-isopropylmalate dehydrogenase